VLSTCVTFTLDYHNVRVNWPVLLESYQVHLINWQSQGSHTYRHIWWWKLKSRQMLNMSVVSNGIAPFSTVATSQHHRITSCKINNNQLQLSTYCFHENFLATTSENKFILLWADVSAWEPVYITLCKHAQVSLDGALSTYPSTNPNPKPNIYLSPNPIPEI